jgi:UDP-N-acetylglucosamine 2-epimerase (non-hydrolysing)
MSLVRSAKVVITDSGGIQEETTYLDIPCLTLRENTERPITVTQGTNKLVTTQNLSENVDKVLSDQWTKGTKPDFWDGQSSLKN